MTERRTSTGIFTTVSRPLYEDESEAPVSREQSAKTLRESQRSDRETLMGNLAALEELQRDCAENLDQFLAGYRHRLQLDVAPIREDVSANRAWNDWAKRWHEAWQQKRGGWTVEQWRQWSGALQDDVSELGTALMYLRRALDNDDAATAALHAMGAGMCATRIQARRVEPQLSGRGNLQPRRGSVTDEQIAAVVNDPSYRTRQQQADRLGISKRALEKRLSEK